jgi:NUDIX domain
MHIHSRLRVRCGLLRGTGRKLIADCPVNWRRLTPAQSNVKAIRRELYEETGLRVEIGSLLGVLDRRDKDSITLLFAAVPNKSSIKVKQNNKEIKKADAIGEILLVSQERPS